MKLKSFDFIGKKNIFFIVSLVLIAIIALCTIFMGVEMDVQFKGGTIITYSYSDENMDFDELTELVEDTMGLNIRIDQKSGLTGGADSFDIVVPSSDDVDAQMQNDLTEALNTKYGDSVILLSSSSVDPVIGKEFFLKGITAILFAFIVLIIYIGFRFKKINGLSAGITAIVALVHDVIIVFGTFVIFRIPLDDNFIAVVLTILGYSINDTIVIYDRLRENKRLYGRSLSTAQLVNNSINETLTRTLGTSGAVLGTLVVVCIVAAVSNVSSIISFAFPMLAGAISGTYSTIFIAGPLWVMWQDYKEKRDANKKNNVKKSKKSKIR